MALPLPDKIVLTLYHVEDMSYEEIAIVTGLPVGTGKSHLFGARRRLKDRLLARYGRGVVTRHLTDRQLQEWVAGGTRPRRVPSVCSSGRVVVGFGAPPVTSNPEFVFAPVALATRRRPHVWTPEAAGLLALRG